MQPVAVKTYGLSAAAFAKPEAHVSKRAEPKSQPQARQPPKPQATTTAPQSNPSPRLPPPPPPPDRSRLDAAEEAVRTFQKEAVRQRAALEKRRVTAERSFTTEAQKIDGQEQAVLVRLERERRRFESSS